MVEQERYPNVHKTGQRSRRFSIWNGLLDVRAYALVTLLRRDRSASGEVKDEPLKPSLFIHSLRHGEDNLTYIGGFYSAGERNFRSGKSVTLRSKHSELVGLGINPFLPRTLHATEPQQPCTDRRVPCARLYRTGFPPPTKIILQPRRQVYASRVPASLAVQDH